MIIGIVKEVNESRVALVPQIIKKITKLGDVDVLVPKGVSPLFSDEAYVESGATLCASADEVFEKSDVFFLLNAPDQDAIKQMKRGALCVSHMNPYANRELLDTFASTGVNAICMEMIPRSTLAQKMDALSSQASLAGYMAVVKGADKLNKIFPMMMTPSGTIPPAKVFVIGAGVAGLQAIATAKRLGAKVEAYDTRPVVEEQVQSLGAKFLKIDLGEMGQTKDGYAKELSQEQLDKQQEMMKQSCVNADLVITTAKLFGRKAPVIVNKDMVAAMKPGSVIVDMAASDGGNVEGSQPDTTVDIGGVAVIGAGNLAQDVPLDASTMYANNVFNLFNHFYDKETNAFVYHQEDEILVSSLITFEGKVVNQRMIAFWGLS